MRRSLTVLALPFAAILIAVASLVAETPARTRGADPAAAKALKGALARTDAATKQCVGCHEEMHVTPDVNRQWAESRHGQRGISCLACHQAQPEDGDKWEHNGVLIATVPSPRDCGRCHKTEVGQFEKSHHAKAAQFIGSLDNVLGEIAEGGPAANMGCRQCHGSTVKLDEQGQPVAGTWPNTGIGRVNPDGSLGSCTACHTRHTFSAAQAREPRTCGRCHLGPDHPQTEIYEESKHGILFAAFRDRLNMGAKKWILGETYNTAPTCATCHMGATRELPVTHDVGDRISWTLRPTISKRLDNWETRRGQMKVVCGECHAATWTEGYFRSFDDTVELWNTKFGAPASAIMDRLKAEKKITPTPFDDPIEWDFYELWHHEGRRARMGASMMGPDYTQWHGFYEVAKHFYTKFLPEAEQLLPGVTRTTLDMPEHQWQKGMSPEQIQQMIDFYKARYGQKSEE